jgi:hypothetical protein
VVVGDALFLIAFTPARLALPRPDDTYTTIGADLWIYGPAEPVEIRLSLEDAGGLVVRDDRGLPSTGAPGEPLHAGTDRQILIDVHDTTQVGEHRVVIRADGPPGAEPVRATLIVDVLDPSRPVPVSPSPTPHTETYAVLSRVTASDVGGVGNRARARWTMVFACADGRCDAELHDGGPRGGLSFPADYQPTTESYRFDFAVDLPTDSDCSTQDMTGRIEPAAWDSRGPLRFEYVLKSVLRCPRGDIRVTWTGEGRRR